MSFNVRDAGPDDVASLNDVFRRSSLSNVNDRVSLLEHPEALEFSGSSLAVGRVRVATVQDDRIVGFATTSVRDGWLELVDLFVDPNWMRRGIGRLLINDVVAFAESSGIARVEVTGNPHASAFYDQVGFIADGESQTEFGVGFRMHLDANT